MYSLKPISARLQSQAHTHPLFKTIQTLSALEFSKTNIENIMRFHNQGEEKVDQQTGVFT